jgi:pSer/pThr/pTyr-binding forkhead associated (FHA) protein
MATIIVASGPQKGEYLPLGQRTNVIGRAESVPLQILDDGVSRIHTRISYDPTSQKHCVEDMNSRHGTMVNMKRVSAKRQLSEGDQILIGSTILLFTEKDFDTRESALMHSKTVGQKARATRPDADG